MVLELEVCKKNTERRPRVESAAYSVALDPARYAAPKLFETLSIPIGNAPTSEIVGRHFDGYTITHEDADAILAHLP